MYFLICDLETATAIYKKIESKTNHFDVFFDIAF